MGLLPGPKVTMDDLVLAHLLSLRSGHLLNLSKNVLYRVENIRKVFNAFVQPSKVDHVLDVLGEVVLGHDMSVFDLSCSPIDKASEPFTQCLAQMAALRFKGLGSRSSVIL